MMRVVFIVALLSVAASVQGFAIEHSFKPIRKTHGDLRKRIERLSSLRMSLLEAYSNSLIKYPFVTKMISSGIVGGLGDSVIQSIGSMNKPAGEKVPFSYRRLLVFTTVCALYNAPMYHTNYEIAERVPIPANCGKIATSLAKLCFDQTIGVLVITTGFFFAFEMAERIWPPYLKDRESGFTAGMRQVQRNLWPVLKANWKCWPAINFLGFMYVPLQFRVLYASVASLFWNMYLSNVANSSSRNA